MTSNLSVFPGTRGPGKALSSLQPGCRLMIEYNEWNSKVAVWPSFGLLALTLSSSPSGPKIPLTCGDLKRRIKRLKLVFQTHALPPYSDFVRFQHIPLSYDVRF